MAKSTAEVLGMRVDKIRRRIVKELVIGAATVPIAGASLLACSRGGEEESGDKVFLPGPPPSPRSAPSKPIVYRARREGILPEGALFGDRDKIADGLGAAIARASEEADPISGFRRLFRPTDVVGIKINGLAGRAMSARPEVVSQVTRWLQDAGVPARNIVVFEREARELVRAGFPLNDSGDGVRVIGTDGDFDRKRRDWGPNSSRFSRILVDEITALINVGVLKDGGLAGVAIGMKDWYGVIHNPQRCHDDGCHPYIAHLAAYPLISDKLRITIVDALLAQCQAGPMYDPRWTWTYGGFLVSTDPVALDAVGMQVIEERRKEIGLPSLAQERRAPKWIAEAARIGLGEANLARIKIPEV
jgi:uncharacterized protein (DUF362 family)